MSNSDRDYVQEAMDLIDNTTLLLPERAHLVALHRYHTTLLNQRVTQLLVKLDCEHSHLANCETCDWIAQQPEWPEMVEARRER